MTDVVYMTRTHYEITMKQISSLNKQVADYNRINSELYTCNQRINDRLLAAYTTIHEKEQYCKYLTDTLVGAVLHAVADINTQVAKMQEDVVELTESNERLTAENKELKAKQEVNTASTMHLKSSIEDIEDALNALRAHALKKMSNIEHEVGALRVKQTPKIEVAETQEEITLATKKLAILKNMFAESKKTMENKLTNLEAFAKDLKSTSGLADEQKRLRFLQSAHTFRNTVSEKIKKSERSLAMWAKKMGTTMEEYGVLFDDFEFLKSLVTEELFEERFINSFLERPGHERFNYANLQEKFTDLIKSIKSLKEQEKQILSDTASQFEALMGLLA